MKNLSKFAALLCCLLISISAMGQNISIKCSDTPLKEVLKTIQSQSSYKFVYNGSLVDMDRKVSVDVENSDIEKILEQVFAGTQITYKIMGNQITLSPKAAARQGKTKVTGTVKDNTGETLPGVYVKSASGVSAITNLDGIFEMEASDGEELAFSFMGMKDTSVNADIRRNMTVVMAPDIEYLENAVVTGYQTISKERATGSYNVIAKAQIEKPASSIAERLIGQTAGMQSTVSADGDVSFEIRGLTSLSTNAAPLLVVDGFAISDSFSSINPNDVESISVLKDAAAASIWGAKSANGVIVITTKSGRNLDKGSVKVDFSAMFKLSPKIDWKYYNPVASSSELVDFELKAWNNGNGIYGSAYYLPNEDNYQEYGRMSLVYQYLNENRLGYLSTSEMNAKIDALRNIDNSDQIKKYLLQNPFIHQYNLNVSSRGERMTNVLSLMYEHNDKYLKGNNSNKYNVGLRSTTKVFKWLDFNFNGNITVTDTQKNGIDLGTLAEISPYQELVDKDGNLVKFYQSLYGPTVQRYFEPLNFPYSDWKYNPIEEMRGHNNTTNRISLRAQAGLTFHIIPGLDFDSKFQYEMIQAKTKNINDETTFATRWDINNSSSWDHSTGVITKNRPTGSIMSHSANQTNAYNWRNQLSFNRGFDDDRHQVSVVAGTEMSNKVYQTTSYPKVYGYDDEKLTVGGFPNGVGGSGVYKLTNMFGSSITNPYTSSFSYSTDRYFSMYINASYTFDKKYTISGSARTDASNLITDDPAYRFSPFWSVGASWNAKREVFLADVDWLDELKVRGTFGYNGNVDKTTSFRPLINMSTAQNSYFQNYTASVSSYGNPTLRWEKTGTVDLGVDFSMFKGKLYGKLDFYNRHGKDLIVSMSIPAVNGTTSQKLNAAEMVNGGVEIELGTTLSIYGRDIVWSGNMNFSYNNNKITKLFKSSVQAYDLYMDTGTTYAYYQGYNANTLWSLQYKGLKNTGSETSPKMRPVVLGPEGAYCDFLSWVTGGDPTTYLVNQGTVVAPFTLGFNGNFKIYDFDLSYSFTGKFGHVFRGFGFNYPYSYDTMPNKALSEIMASDGSNLATPPPFDAGEDRYYFWDRFYPYLDYLTQSASHLRLQELNVAYTLPRRYADRIGLSNIKVYLQGNNLFVISGNKWHEDPEYPLGSVRPSPAYTLGLNITF